MAEAAGSVDKMPLSALLSFTLVAFTLDCDNDVELGLSAQGRDSMVSLVAWLNVVQYLGGGPTQVAEICERTFTKPAQTAFVLGCLERWGFVSISAGIAAKPRTSTASGFGSGRGINAKSSVTLTNQGEAADDQWRRGVNEVEARWQMRYGSTLTEAQAVLRSLVSLPGVAMPEGVPSGWMQGDWRQFPAGAPAVPACGCDVPVLFGRALLAVTIAYERSSLIGLALGANTLRVATAKGTPVADLPFLTGLPSEATGAQTTELTRRGLCVLAKNPVGRGKALSLTVAGQLAQRTHNQTLTAVAGELGSLGGDATAALQKLLTHSSAEKLSIHASLLPPLGVRRAGAAEAALEAAHASVRARNRELVAQTEAFVADPFNALPQYPVWQGTRNFGP